MTSFGPIRELVWGLSDLQFGNQKVILKKFVHEFWYIRSFREDVSSNTFSSPPCATNPKTHS